MSAESQSQASGSRKIRVLFVCTGNICRSPMAEAVFMHLVHEAGLGDWMEADSAGLISYHVGEPAHSGTLRVLNRNGILGYAGRARQLTRNDFSQFDYVIAMDDEHLAEAARQKRNLESSDVTVARLLDYAPEVREREVPDPYYNGAFDRVYDLVLAGARGLLAQIRADHNLD